MKILSLSIGLTLIVGCQVEESTNQTLNGMWELVSMNVDDSTGSSTPYRGGMQGYLIYASEGNVALHLSDADFEATTESFRNFTDTLNVEKLKYLTKSYHYLGKFEILKWNEVSNRIEGQVQHTKFAHSNPNEWGERSIRNFQLSGDTLWMQPEEKANSSLKLIWHRIKSQ